MGGKRLTRRSLKRKSAGHAVHPDSRRAAQLARISHREDKIAKAKAVRRRHANDRIDRLTTQLLLLPSEWTRVPDLASLHAFLQSTYLARHDDEILSLQRQRASRARGAGGGGGTARSSDPPSKREVALVEERQAERTRYEQGNLEVVDLLDEDNVAVARRWEGDVGGLASIRLVRVSGRDKSQYIITQQGHRAPQAPPRPPTTTSKTSSKQTPLTTTQMQSPSTTSSSAAAAAVDTTAPDVLPEVSMDEPVARGGPTTTTTATPQPTTFLRGDSMLNMA